MFITLLPVTTFNMKYKSQNLCMHIIISLPEVDLIRWHLKTLWRNRSALMSKSCEIMFHCYLTVSMTCRLIVSLKDVRQAFTSVNCDALKFHVRFEHLMLLQSTTGTRRGPIGSAGQVLD